MFLSLAKGIALGAVLSYLAPLPLMMAGLALGWTAALIAGTAMMAAVAVAAGTVFVLPAAVGVALPALVVSNRALLWRNAADGTLHWYPPGHVLAWLTATGLVLMLIGMALVVGRPEGIRGFVTEVIGQTLDMVAAEVPEETRKKVADMWVPMFPAMVIGSWLVMSALNAIGAQALVARLGRARRTTPVYRELTLPDWLGIALTVAVVAAVLTGGDPGYAATNMVVVLLVPFVCLGLAGIHRWAFGRPNARLVLAATYGLLILAIGWAAAAVAGLGLVRFWTMRFRRPKSGGGMEE